MPDGETRRPGRPRDETLRDKVLAATVTLLASSTASEEVTIGAIVAVSGVSRAAIYRRWTSREAVLADALDTVRTEYPIDDSLPTVDCLFSLYAPEVSGYPSEQFERLFRRRLALSLEDAALREKYWSDHVARRRVAVIDLLERAKVSGEVRADVDVEATVDLLAGVGYYQVVARPDEAPESVVARLRSAVRIVWHGITAR